MEKLKTTSNRILALDGLRGIAVSMVLFWHFVLCTIPIEGGTGMGYLYKSFKHFYSGVDLFFVLSGFLITGILLNDIGKPRWLKDFWIRRSFRILPIYALFLVVVLSLNYLPGERTGGFFSAPSPKWPYFVMLQNFAMASSNSLGSWGITWSLAIEEQFYLVFPLLLTSACARAWLPMLCLLGIAGSLLLRINGEYLYSFVLSHYRLDGLAAGAACAWVVRKPEMHKWFQNHWGGLLLAVGLVAMVGITLRARERHPIDHTVFAVFYASIIMFAILNKNSWLTWLLSSSALRFLGAISYPLYLFHEIVAWAIHLMMGRPVSNGAHFWLTAFLAAFVSVLLAWAINRYLGQPMLNFGRRLIAGNPGSVR